MSIYKKNSKVYKLQCSWRGTQPLIRNYSVESSPTPMPARKPQGPAGFMAQDREHLCWLFMPAGTACGTLDDQTKNQWEDMSRANAGRSGLRWSLQLPEEQISTAGLRQSHTCQPSIWKAEAEGFWAWEQTHLCSKTLRGWGDRWAVMGDDLDCQLAGGLATIQSSVSRDEPRNIHIVPTL